MYKKSQYGWLIILILSVVLINLYFTFIFQWGDNPLPLVPFFILSGILVFVILIFYKMTVHVKPERVRISYGIGLINFNINIDKLKSIKEINTPWYYGIGIRITPKGMLYSIQGLKAVIIEYISDGKDRKVMIGTAEPQQLKKAIADNFNK